MSASPTAAADDDHDADAAPGPGSVCIILNPGAGRRRNGEADRALRDAFARHPGRFALRRISRGEGLHAAAARAAREGHGTVAAAGGDGTVNAVAAALAALPRPPRLGVVPLGTFNFFARSLDLPLEIADALDLLAEGPERALALGEVNGRVFLDNASLGVYPAILATRERAYARFGRTRVAAHGAALAALSGFRSPLDARVTVDGTERRGRTPLVFVAANAFQLERMGFPEAAERVRAGDFAVFLVPDGGRARLVAFAAALAMGRLRPGRDLEVLHGREVRVETRRPRRVVALDGERERMEAPFRFRRHPDALRVAAPPA